MTASVQQVVVLTDEDVTVVAGIPATMSLEMAQQQATRIYDAGLVRKERHYDRYARGDYDLVGYFCSELKKAGLTIIVDKGPDL